MGMYKDSSRFTLTAHKANAERAYIEYRKIQARIERHEAYAKEMYKDNDRQVQRWLESSEEDHAYRYRALCGQRAAYQQVIATETAMASLYM
jgi:hypothetical protein